jgi:hypothetical protein
MTQYLRLSLVLISGALIACTATETPSQYDVADAGDEAFVKRVVPLMWGRKPSSIREVSVLVQLIQQSSRAEVVYRMSRSPEFIDRWSVFLRDHLGVFRLGDQANQACYGQALVEQDRGAIALHIRDSQPTDQGFSTPFTMVDVTRSALWLDDLSPVFEAHLFAWLKQDYALPDPGAAKAARQAKSEVFMHRWLGRRMECLTCHNSEYSVTDAVEPELDRFWPVQGFFEKAVFGQSQGIGHENIRPFFRRYQVVAGIYYDGDGPSTEAGVEAEIDSALAPWGIDKSCGRFKPSAQLGKDDLGESGSLADKVGDRVSIWDLETLMRRGFDNLRGKTNPSLNTTNLTGADSLAWMTSQHFVDSVWREVFGQRLTISTWFPRTRQQRDKLALLTDYYVQNGYSLGALLAAITTGEYFNRSTPVDTPASAQTFADLFDPWTNDEISPSQRRNHSGHMVHRLPARVLLGSVYHALGWHPPTEFPETFLSKDAVIQRSAGVYLKDGDSGFAGISFQSQLAWDDVFGACIDEGPCPIRAAFERGELTQDDICLICTQADTICTLDDRCCDIVDGADTCPPDCPVVNPSEDSLERLLTPPANANWLARMVKDAQNLTSQGTQLTLGDVLGALKDRLLSDPLMTDPAEVALIEAVAGQPLDDPIDPLDLTLEARVRQVCGVWLASPDFQLWGWTGPNRLGSSPSYAAPDTGFRMLCERIGSELYGEGQLLCDETTAQLQR